MIQRHDETGASEEWAAVVIGAGVAGIVAARRLVDLGVATLLVEARKFPRDKVCGGCLNERAVEALGAAGFGRSLRTMGGAELRRLELWRKGRVVVPTPVGIAVTRRTLDSALVQDAIDAGVVFRDGVRAQLLAARTPQGRLVRLTGDAGATTTVRARVVVAADGLGSPSLARDRAFGTRSAPGSRVGLGLRLESPSSLCERGSALMAIGRRGYVGMVICESGVLNAAAAVDPAALRGRSSAGEVVASILCEAGVPNPFEGASSPWSTVPRLTQSATTVAADRVFLVGDAAGYVEPFTGEGMANAAEDALRVAPLAAEAATEWSDALGERWRAYDRHVRAARSRDCRRLAWLLRHPALVSVAMRTAALAPSLAARLTRRVSAPRATFAGRLP